MTRLPDWVMKCAALGGSTAISAWMRSLEYCGLFYDPQSNPIYPTERARIYVFWHEYILMPLYLCGHCRLTMLLSRHRDADILYRLAYHMGFECVRGSSFGGGAAAVMELARQSGRQHLAITPDGPRGPRRRLAPGPIYLASRLGLPIVPIGFGVDRPYRLKTWDRFAIPRFGSQVRGIVGPEVFLPPDMTREQLEAARVGVERLLNDLCDDADEWAASGETRVGAVAVRRRLLFDPRTASWDGGARDLPLVAQATKVAADATDQTRRSRRAA